ncbi:PQQ-dependent sugar dehydrogenase [Marinagarivorans algicola]|uniref:PQQ-dependent sugar dehydrogenase n=1 Tax=Marinagarivorans algicola TaxID=1513270 RepID=UPI003736A613
MSRIFIFSTNLLKFVGRKRLLTAQKWGRQLTSTLVIAACLLPIPGLAAPSTWNEAYFRGTANNWGASPMTYDETNSVWTITQTFSTNNPRFKIARFNNWNEAYPNADFLISTGPGDYTITFNDVTKEIQASLTTSEPDPEPEPIGANTLCFDNAQNFAEPTIYYWAATPEDSLNNLPQWPGRAMTAVGEYYCFDFTPYLGAGNTLPTRLNIIFNNKGANQTGDLTFNGNACYQDNTWVSLSACGFDTAPTLSAEAGDNRSVAQGANTVLSAAGSQGAYTSATWTSSAWPGALTGSPTVTPALNTVGQHVVTLTLSNGTTTVQDTFTLTVTPADTGHGMNQRPELAQPLAFPISGNVSAGNYRFEKAFPNLDGQFLSPVMILPDGINDLIFVVDKPGSIFVFPNKETVTSGEVREVLNIQSNVRNYHEQGLLSMAFDPNYATNGFIYIYYIQGNDDNEQAPNGDHGDAILERWTINNPSNPTRVVQNSNVEVLRIEQPGPDHKGGMMQFHPEDGYLYLSVGDGAYGHSAITPFPDVDGRTNNSAQDTTNLRGSLIRIQPLEFPLNNQYYTVPNDNPFIGVAGFRPEIYSYGHRNPWRWSFDTEAPYTLWQTEVGQAGFEEVNVIQKGKNYGWPVCEGTTNRQELGGDPAKNCITDFEPPREGYFQPEGFSIIGGIVYRGNKLPGLTGRFIFGDYVTKKIWSIVDGDAKALISDAFPENIVSFGTDLSGEELFVSTYGVEYGGNSTIYKVVDDDAEAAVIPAKLSATGLFSDLRTLTPVSGVIEYEINSNGWFDGAQTQHFISIPNDATIDFDATGDWALPVGSVAVKHLSVKAAGNTQKPFTTSVLFKQATGNWQAANYYWNADGTDADLVTQTRDVLDGGIDPRMRAVQASADCGSCHTGSGSKEPLALHTRQWNKDFDYNGVIDNQLEAFDYVGLFSDNIGSADSYDRYAAIDDTRQSSGQRARAYLDTNCSHCHSSGFMDLRFDTPLADTRLIDPSSTGRARLRPFEPNNSLIYIYQTSDGNRMPKGSRHTNPQAQALFEQWINAADAQQIGLALTSNNTRFLLGDTLNVTVTALLDNDFQTNKTGPIIWSSSNSNVINTAGLTGNTLTIALDTVGETTLSAQAGGDSASLSITVTDSDVSVTSLNIAPSTVALVDQQQLVAFGTRNDGSNINLFGEVTWEVTGGTDAITVNSTGLVTRIANGNGQVTARYQGVAQTLDITQARQDFVLQYDNTNSNWAQVSAYVWTETNGQVTAVADWPGIPMTGPNADGIWRYTVAPDVLVNGEVNVIFNNTNGDKTDDLLGIKQASIYKDGMWEPLAPSTALSRLAIIAGSTPSGALDFAVGSVVTVTADTPPLGTQFNGWSGDGIAYIISDPSQTSIQVLIPEQGISLQAKFNADATDYSAARTLYAGNCAQCHGADGSGGVSLAINQLHTSNRYTQDSLSSYISNFMPLGNPSACTGTTPGDCAFSIAKMILNDEWSACSGSECVGTSLDTRNLRLLTRTEYLNSVRDIFGIAFSDTIMSSVPADGTFRNYTTASTLVADNDRTLGFDIAANEIANIAIAATGFNGLASGCGNNRVCTVQQLGRKIFRRPLSNAEAQRYAALYDAREDGVTVVQGLLMSPHFMYRSELGELNRTTGLYELTDYEMATLLAYTFWVTTPDATLLDAAEAGNLNIEQQTRRLLADPRSEQGLRRFASGWLINNQYPFPAITRASLVDAFKEETIRFVMAGIRDNAPFNTLLSADYTYANSELAAHYGIAPTGNWTRAFFPADDERSGSGLLGHGSFLASRTSTVNPAPIKRGVYVREAIMCQEFPPPAAANFDITFEPSDSNRDATSRHTADPACATCHQYIDGVGFGFERFDSSGLYRTSETLGNGTAQPIDDSGSIKSLYSPETVLDPDSTSFPYFSVPELAALIADSGQGEACFSRQFYRYTVGRNESSEGDELLIRSYSQDLRNGGGMLDMLIDLTTSQAFGVRR